MKATIYVIAYCLGMAWFAGYLFVVATDPANQGAGDLFFYQTLGIAIAPCALIWLVRRLITGRWLSPF